MVDAYHGHDARRPLGKAAAPRRTGHSHYIDISTVAHSSPFLAVFIGAATLGVCYLAARYAGPRDLPTYRTTGHYDLPTYRTLAHGGAPLVTTQPPLPRPSP